MSPDTDETLENLQKVFLASKEEWADVLLNRLEEATPYELGYYKGHIDAFEEAWSIIRNKLKYGK